MTIELGLDADLVKRLRDLAKQGPTVEPSSVTIAEAAERIEFLFEAFAKCTRSLRSYHERIEALEAALQEIAQHPSYGESHVIAWKALAGKP